MRRKWLFYTGLGIGGLIVVSLVLTIWLPVIQSFRIVFGLVYLLFLPGFVWSWVFWKTKELNTIERFILSLVLSIALVPLITFLLNKLGVKINLFNSILEIGTLIIFALIIIYFNSSKMKINLLKNK